MKEKLIWQDSATRIVLKSVVVGHFAMWAVRQSPYLFPKGLNKGIKEFNEDLISSCIVCDTDFIESTYAELKKNITDAISKSPIILSWNVAKKGSGPVFVTSYSHLKPDYDYIDLDALARNIAQSVWLELCYSDGAFEEGAGHME